MNRTTDTLQTHVNRRARLRSKRTHASAQLEFVMCLPFMLALFAMMASVGLTSLEKSGTAIFARRDVWKLRGDPQSAGDELDDKSFSQSQAFSMLEIGNPVAGEVYGVKRGEVKVFPWLGEKRQPRSRAAVLAQTWDHKHDDVFSETGPHFAIVERMVGGTGEFSQTAVNAIAQLLSLGSVNFENASDIQDANNEVAKAEEKKKEADDKIKKEMDDIKKEIVRLEKELRDLNTDREKEIRDRKTAQDKLDKLVEDTEDLDPVPADKLAEMKRLRDQIRDHTTEITRLDGEIKRVEDELYVQRKTLENYEKQLQRVDEEQRKTGQGDVEERLKAEMEHRERNGLND